MDAAVKTCKQCAAFFEGGGLGQGWCYLSPPTVSVVGMQPPVIAGGRPQPLTVSIRPMVLANDRACAMIQEVKTDGKTS